MKPALSIALLTLIAVTSYAPSPPRKLTDRVAILEASVETLSDRLDALEAGRRPPQKPAAGKKPSSGDWKRCIATASSTGKRCRARALSDSDYCTWHSDDAMDDDPAR